MSLDASCGPRSLPKVLVVHNAYQQRGGEDSVVEEELALLADRGHEVDLFTRHNDDAQHMSRLDLAVQTIWSRPSAAALKQKIEQFRPDVLHVHNTFPLLSPSVLWASQQMGVPVVQTLHNFRLLCPQAMFLRDGRVCEDCLGGMPWAAVRHGCFRGSRAMSGTLTAMIGVHRAIGTWQRRIDRYIALNDFCRRKFIEGGLPADRIVVKPNFVDLPAPTPGPRAGLLFVGRLSPEKGVSTLVEAARGLPEASLRIAGTGPMASTIEALPAITMLGSLDAAGVRREMTAAAALVLPSIWYENFPRTLVEAFACGLPVIASRIGALAELVDDGITGMLFSPGDTADLARVMNWALNHPRDLAAMGAAARLRYERDFTAERNHQTLLAIYDDVIGERRRRRMAEAMA